MDVTDSINVEERTVELAFASELPYERWWGVEVIDTKKMDLSRLNDGGALLWNHDNDNKDSHIGTVEKAWVDDDKKARAVVRFSKKAAAEEVFQDIQDGIVKHVSFGYMITDFEVTKEAEKKDELNEYKVATNSYEVSLVHTPADTSVGVSRSVEQGPDDSIVNVSTNVDETFHKQNLEVSVMENEKTVETIDTKEIEQKAALEAKNLYKSYCSEVKDICKLAGFAEKADGFIDSEAKIEDVRKALWGFKAETEKATEVKTVETVEAGKTHSEKRSGEIEKAILHAVDSRNEKADSYLFTGFEKVGRDMLGATGVDTSMMVKSDIISMLMGRTHSTSDFKDILANIGGKSMLGSYEAAGAQQTWRGLVQERQVPNYNEQTLNRLGEMPTLQEKLEGAEYVEGTIGSEKESYAITDFGRKFSVTDRMLINDNLGAFRSLSKFGTTVARKETEKFWEEFLTGTVGGVSIFHASHNNIAASSEIDVDGLGNGFELLMKQTGIDMTDPLNLVPRHVIVPAAKMRLAQQYLSANFTADTNANVNPYAGSLNLIADARLDADSATNWYMATGPEVDQFEIAYLSGKRAPSLASQTNFDTDSIEMKVKHTFAIKAVEYRGLIKLTP